MPLGANVPTPYPASTGTTYYVDNDTGDDGNSGLTELLAWATVNHACQNAPADADVRVKKGASPYSEQISITRGGTPNNPITIQAFDPDNPPTVLGKITMQSSSAAYWWWRNMDFDGGNVSGNNNLFKLTGSGSDRFASNVGAHHIGFDRCTAHDATGSGGGWITTFNDVHEVQWWNCVSYSNGPQTTAHGWYYNGGNDLYAMNCISRDNGGYGIHIFTDGDQVPSGIKCFNCLAISQDGRAGFLIQYGSGDPDNNALVPFDNHFYNCIGAYQTQGGSSDRYGFRVKSATAISSWAGYGPKNTIASCAAFGNTDGAADIVTPQMVTVANLIQADPMFVDWAAFDYHLQAGSPMIDAGDGLYTPPNDFDGNPRTTADIGPFAASNGGGNGGGGNGGGGNGGGETGEPGHLGFGQIDFPNIGSVERTTEGVLSEPVKGHT